MTTYQLVKSMKRELTLEEKSEIKKFLEDNPIVPFREIIEIFEKKFDTPITYTFITKLCIEMEMFKE